jgi:hypothetical protein
LTIAWSDYPHWDEALRKAVAATPWQLGWDAVAAELGKELNYTFTDDQVRNRARRIGAARPVPEDRARLAIDLERSRSITRSETRELTKAVQQQAQWEEFLDLARSEMAIATLEAPMSIAPVIGSGSPETMVVLISDIHIGKLVDPDVVGGGFGYNKDLFATRLEALAEAIVRLRDIHSARGPINELDLFFLGDGVDGVDMRRGHGARVDIATATQQTVLLARALSGLIAGLEQFFPKIKVGWEYGNHGRVGDFGVNLPADNWDYVAGVMVAEALRDHDNVSVNVHTQKYGIYQIGPLTAYAAHGDMIRGGGGSPVIQRHIANQQNLHRQVFDLVLLGHFHTSQYLTVGGAKVFLNGAWDGGDDFSVNQLVSASDPAQWAFGVHPTRGLTWQYEVQLAPRRPATKVIE